MKAVNKFFNSSPGVASALSLLIVVLLITLLFKNTERFFSAIQFTPKVVNWGGGDASSNITEGPPGTFTSIRACLHF
jgi:hypothetical protein